MSDFFAEAVGFVACMVGASCLGTCAAFLLTEMLRNEKHMTKRDQQASDYATEKLQDGDTSQKYGVWHDRSEQPPQDARVLFYTSELDGFMWIGRRGLLPNNVSHWMLLPPPPGAADAK